MHRDIFLGMLRKLHWVERVVLMKSIKEEPEKLQSLLEELVNEDGSMKD